MDDALPALPHAARRLCRAGVVLMLLGLATGALIPLFENARQGLAAHTAGVQNGMMLTLLGLLWRHLRLTVRYARVAAVSGVISLYALWWGLLLAAAFGTRRATPIAGAGGGGEPWQETLVDLVFGAGSVGLIVALTAVLWGLRPDRPATE